MLISQFIKQAQQYHDLGYPAQEFRRAKFSDEWDIYPGATNEHIEYFKKHFTGKLPENTQVYYNSPYVYFNPENQRYYFQTKLPYTPSNYALLNLGKKDAHKHFFTTQNYADQLYIGSALKLPFIFVEDANPYMLAHEAGHIIDWQNNNNVLAYTDEVDNRLQREINANTEALRGFQRPEDRIAYRHTMYPLFSTYMDRAQKIKPEYNANAILKKDKKLDSPKTAPHYPMMTAAHYYKKFFNPIDESNLLKSALTNFWATKFYAGASSIPDAVKMQAGRFNYEQPAIPYQQPAWNYTSAGHAAFNQPVITPESTLFYNAAQFGKKVLGASFNPKKYLPAEQSRWIPNYSKPNYDNNTHRETKIPKSSERPPDNVISFSEFMPPPEPEPGGK